MRSGDVVNGRYRLLERLGPGAFGTVWRAYDPWVQRAVAVKICVPRSAGEELRLAREARLNGGLHHPRIATVHDFGATDLGGERAFFLVMELVEGETLSAVLRRGLPPLPDALEWAAQICAALAAAHDAGVVHRDIKPANVMITRSGAVKVLDFGIARQQGAVTELTGRGSLIGSMPYMAPERWTNEGVDGRSDLYALGCVLMELCTGRLPFLGQEWQELCVQHTVADPPRPSDLRPGLPPALDELTRRLLAKDPADRPADARETERLLRAVPAGPPGNGPGGARGTAPDGAPGSRLGGAPVTGPAGPSSTAARRRSRARRVTAVAVAVAVLAAGSAAGVWYFTGDRDHGPGRAGSTAPHPATTPPVTAGPATRTGPPGVVPSDGSTGTPHPGPSTGEPAPSPSRAPRPPALPDGWFRLTNAASRMCLTVPDAAVNAAQGLVQATCANGTEQLWRLTEEEPGLYSVRNANSALCLSVDAARKENGVVITQYLCGDEEHPLFPDQVWGFRWDATYRAWRLVNRHSGKCVTVRPGGGDREQVLQWDCGDESWRLWRT